MTANELYELWTSDKPVSLIQKDLKAPKTEAVAEICLYKQIDHEDLDAVLLTTSEVSLALKTAEENGYEKLIVHYGYYFNAEYDSVMALIGFIQRRFKGTVYALSPDEVIFLSIRGSKSVKDVLEDLHKEGIKHLWGYITPSVNNSKYYSDEDELMVDDRHHFYEMMSAAHIKAEYPFNLGSADYEDEFIDMVNYVSEHSSEHVILQPNPLIDTDVQFNYARAEEIFLSLFPDGKVPLNRIGTETCLATHGGYVYNLYDIERMAFIHYKN